MEPLAPQQYEDPVVAIPQTEFSPLLNCANESVDVLPAVTLNVALVAEVSPGEVATNV